MATTRIGPKHQVTIPKDVFEKLHLEVGDLLDAAVDKGKLILVPKRLAEKAPAPKLTDIEQKLLRKAQAKIQHIRRDLASAKGLSAEEAEVAAKSGLIARDQRWWWTEKWQEGERAAERDIRTRRTRAFESAEELLQELRSR